MDRHSSDGYKRCTCGGLRMSSQALLCIYWHALGRRVRALRSPFSALSSPPYRTTTINISDRVAIRASGLGLYEHRMCKSHSRTAEERMCAYLCQTYAWKIGKYIYRYVGHVTPVDNSYLDQVLSGKRPRLR